MRHAKRRRLHQRDLAAYVLTPKGYVLLTELHDALRGAVETLMQLYLDPAPNTPEGRTLAWMATLLERIERVLYPFPDATPIELARWRREVAADALAGPPPP